MISTSTIRAAVAGGGSWGTALAHVLATAGHPVTIVLRDEAVARSINERHENPHYLPGRALHPGVRASTSPEAFAGCGLLVMAVPCQHQRAYWKSVHGLLDSHCVIVNASKGLETGTCLAMSQVAEEEMPGCSSRYAVLSGPSFAAEVMDAHPTAVVLASRDEALASSLRGTFSTPFFRCYSSTDVIGVEAGGALKNVMAIAAGMCDGLGFGSNARAALVTRGLAELSRIGTAMGARPLTFMGLSGLGDLVLTCGGDLSRNRQVGLRLGRGETLEQIVTSLGMVAEGVKTSQAARQLALRLQVSAPVTKTVCRIIEGGTSAREAVTELMGRTLKEE